MIQRVLQQKCKTLFSQYPVLTITGPRQSGKTTLARTTFPDKPYINLENPDQRQRALDDPRSFLSDLPEGAILDEIQRAPEIPSYLQGIVDESGKNGLFILTGSQQFEISNSISQSLAGRTAVIRLLPFSIGELQEADRLPGLDSLLIRGQYPRLYKDNLDPHTFYMNYFETYVQRDLRQLSQIENLSLFEKFVRLLAGRIGQLVNFNSLANDLGISQPTAKKWLSLLEASYIVFLLPPFFKNRGKRLVKTPKVYFHDTGLAAFLMSIRNEEQLTIHPLRGNLFENLIVMDHLKRIYNKAEISNLYFYRDRSGNEVDLIAEHALSLDAIEIKAAQTFNAEFCRNPDKFQTIYDDLTVNKAVIYAGDRGFPFKDTLVRRWDEID